MEEVEVYFLVMMEVKGFEKVLMIEDLLRQCPHHGFSELHQLDTFYNALNLNDQDALDSAAGGNFLDKIPRECLLIIKSKSKVRYSKSQVTDFRANTNAPPSSSSPFNSFYLQQIAASLEDKLDICMNRFEKSLNDMKAFITPTAPIKAVEEESEESENGGKDEREQQFKESVNKQVDSCTNVIAENIKEGESDSGKKEEVDIEIQNNEVGEANGVKECETIGGTQELSPENKDKVTELKATQSDCSIKSCSKIARSTAKESEESENGGKDEREQQLKESVNKQVDSCINVITENIKKGELDSGKKEEVDIKIQNNEAGEADGVKECETIGGTQELSPKNKDKVTGEVSKSTEGVSQYFKILYDNVGSPLGDETDDETLKKKEDQYTETEKCAKTCQQVSTIVMYDKSIKAIRVKVPDSSEEFLLNPATVRRNDHYAQSVDEWTGEQKLLYGDIPEDIEPEEIRPMGNHTVLIAWPDGFSQKVEFETFRSDEAQIDIRDPKDLCSRARLKWNYLRSDEAQVDIRDPKDLCSRARLKWNYLRLPSKETVVPFSGAKEQHKKIERLTTPVVVPFSLAPYITASAIENGTRNRLDHHSSGGAILVPLEIAITILEMLEILSDM
nr:Fe-S cluster assembly factor HCF101, chloroplastic [Tanacetum cinerariifolium]